MSFRRIARDKIQHSRAFINSSNSNSQSTSIIMSSPSQQQRRLRTSESTSSSSTSTNKPLYAQQHLLPHLPVPTLNSTFNKYLETLHPLLPPSAHSKSTQLVKSFLDSPLSDTLQARLESRASEKESWLSEWWNEAAYMGYRDSIVPNVNYFYLHKAGAGKGVGRTRRGAELIRGVRAFRELLVSEKLSPETIKSKPLDASAYPALFNSSRIPTSPSDTFQIYPPAANEHIVVLCNNRIYKVGTKGLGVKELEEALEGVVKKAEGKGEGKGVGALTADSRDAWTEARTHLISLSSTNAQHLETIQSSILVLALDSHSTPADASRDERSWDLYTGDGEPGKNRWFDKHQVVVDVNGESGFNGEHSMLDGTPTLRMNEFVLAALEAGKISLDLDPETEKPAQKAEVEELEFVLDDKAEAFIESSKKAFATELKRHDLKVVQFDHYGKDLIKKHKVSPDAWVQMVKQLAYGKMNNGRPAVTYESAQTRKFRLGRTEVIRVASRESKAFVESMLDQSKSDTERAKLFRAAAGRHIQYASWAADGQGVDRHMFGLKKLLRKGEEMPEVFTDEAFALSSTWTLSTSNLTSEYLDNWGYGQVVAEGFGLSYSISGKYLRWNIMTTTGKADELKESLIWAADELAKVMERASKSESVGDKAKL